MQFVTTNQEATALTDLFGHFHDSCIREVHIWTETSVGENLHMSCPGHLDSHLKILFQRQFANPSAIELQFDEMTGFRMTPTPDNYDSIIWGASITLENGIFYWRQEEDDGENWIAGKKLRWRDASSWMGPDLHYGIQV